MYYLIENGPIRWPHKDKHGFDLTEDAKSLISQLLEKDKSKRLGKKGDAKEVLDHPWFKELNMEDMLAKKVKPPYVPEIKNKDDVSNFDEKFRQLEVKESILDK